MNPFIKPMLFFSWLLVRLSNFQYKFKPSKFHKKNLLGEYKFYKKYGGKNVLPEAEAMLLEEQAVEVISN